jgi:hypothetical protein
VAPSWTLGDGVRKPSALIRKFNFLSLGKQGEEGWDEKV